GGRRCILSSWLSEPEGSDVSERGRALSDCVGRWRPFPWGRKIVSLFARAVPRILIWIHSSVGWWFERKGNAAMSHFDSNSTDRTNRREAATLSPEQYFERTLERCVVAAVVDAAGPTRRQLLAGLGGAAVATLIGDVLPLERLKAFAADPVGK